VVSDGVGREVGVLDVFDIKPIYHQVFIPDVDVQFHSTKVSFGDNEGGTSDS